MGKSAKINQFCQMHFQANPPNFEPAKFCHFMVFSDFSDFQSGLQVIAWNKSLVWKFLDILSLVN